MIQLPSTGPTGGASTPVSMVAMPWRGTGNSGKTAEKRGAYQGAANEVCTTRQKLYRCPQWPHVKTAMVKIPTLYVWLAISALTFAIFFTGHAEAGT